MKIYIDKDLYIEVLCIRGLILEINKMFIKNWID